MSLQAGAAKQGANAALWRSTIAFTASFAVWTIFSIIGVRIKQVSDFLAEADEESWADLVSALRDARDPGAACVAKVTAFRVRLETAA